MQFPNDSFMCKMYCQFADRIKHQSKMRIPFQMHRVMVFISSINWIPLVRTLGWKAPSFRAF